MAGIKTKHFSLCHHDLQGISGNLPTSTIYLIGTYSL